MSRWTPNYHVACQIQRKILAQMEKSDLKPKDLATLTSAWERLEERKRILRMKPKPRDVEVKDKSKSHKPMTFSE